MPLGTGDIELHWVTVRCCLALCVDRVAIGTNENNFGDAARQKTHKLRVLFAVKAHGTGSVGSLLGTRESVDQVGGKSYPYMC